jgi:hypothetical protein
MVVLHCNHPQRECQLIAIAVLFFVLSVVPDAFAAPPGATSSPEPRAQRQIIDRVVAAVLGQAITASQMEFEVRVLLIANGVSAASVEVLDQAALKSGLQQMIDQRLLVADADKLNAFVVDPTETVESLTRFQSNFESDAQFRAFLEKFESASEDVERILRRMQRAQRTLDGRFRLLAQPAEAEVKAAMAKRQPTDQQTAGEIRSQLFRSRFQTLVSEELKSLRRQGNVRILLKP